MIELPFEWAVLLMVFFVIIGYMAGYTTAEVKLMRRFTETLKNMHRKDKEVEDAK